MTENMNRKEMMEDARRTATEHVLSAMRRFPTLGRDALLAKIESEMQGLEYDIFVTQVLPDVLDAELKQATRT